MGVGKKIVRKIFGPKEVEPVKLAGGNPAITAKLEDLVDTMSISIVQAMASFYLGKGKTIKDPSKLYSQLKDQKTILGDKNSIFSLIETTEKDFEKLLKHVDGKDSIKEKIEIMRKDGALVVDMLAGVQDSLIKKMHSSITSSENNFEKLNNLLSEQLKEINESLKPKDKKDEESAKISIDVNGISDDALKSLAELTKDASDESDKLKCTAITTFISSLNELNEIPNDKIKQLSEGLPELFDNLNMVDVQDDKVEQIGNSMDSIGKMIKTFSTIEESNVDTVNSILPKIAKSFNLFEEENITENISTIFEHITAITSPDMVKVQDIVTGINGINDILSNLKDIKEYENLSIDTKSILKSLDDLKELYEKIKERFEEIEKMAPLADKVKKANDKIKEGLKSCDEVATSHKSNKSAKLAQMTLGDMAKMMLIAATVMLIGAMFMQAMGGKLVKNALLFGVTLGIFEALVLAPILMFGILGNQVAISVAGFGGLVVTLSLIMLVGAVFMMALGGKLVLNALLFGVTLGIFEVLVLAPIMVFLHFMPQTVPALGGFMMFVVTLSLIMLLGAVFMTASNGKYVLGALEFTGLLALFEIGVLAPILVFGKFMPVSTIALAEFTLFVATCALILLTGAIFMIINDGKYAIGALEFTILLGTFVFAIGKIAISIMSEINPATMKAAVDFAIFVALCAFSLSIGSWFVATYGGDSVATFALILGAFVWAMGKIMVQITKNMKDPLLLISLENFEIFVAVCAATLAIGAYFVKTYGADSAALFGIILAGFVAIMGGVMIGLTKWLGEKSLDEIRQFSLFVGICAASLAIGAYFVETYGGDSALIFGAILAGFVAIIGIEVVLLTKFMGDPLTLIALDSFTIFVAVCAATLAIGAIFVETYGRDSVLIFGAILAGFVAIMGVIAYGLTFITEAIPSMMAFSVFVAISAAVLCIGAIFVYEYGVESVESFGACLARFVAIMGVIAYGLTFITGAIPSMMALGVFVMMATAALCIGSIFVHDYGVESVALFGACLVGFIGFLGLVVAGLVLLMPAMIIGIAAVGLLTLLSFSLTACLIGMAYSLQEVQKVGNWNKDTIIKMVEDYLDICDACPNLLEYGVYLAKIELLANLAEPLGKVMLTMAKAVADMSSMKVACAWDKDGNPTEYIQLSNSDFENAANNTRLIITTVADALCTAYEGGTDANGKEIKGIKQLIEDGVLYQVIFASMMMTGTISSVAAAVADMASMKVPEEYDKDGKPSKWRQLNNADFALAIDNTGKIITSLADGITRAYFGGDGKLGLKPLIEEKDSALFKTIDAAIFMGLAVGTIGIGVGLMAMMRVPEEYDKNGKVTKWRQLNEDDFTKANQNVETILLSMGETLNKAYWGNPKSGFAIGKNGLHGLINHPDKPLEQIINASVKIGEVIGNVATGVGDMANLKVAIKYDKDGNAIEWRQLGQDDFDLANDNIGKILLTMFNTMINAYNCGAGESSFLGFSFSTNIWDDGDESPIWTIIKASQTLTGMISTVGQSVADMANLKVATAWDKDGKPTGYETMNKTHFKKANENIATVILSSFSTMFKIYNAGKNGGIVKFGSKTFNIPKGIFEDGDKSPLMTVVNASTKIGNIIKGIAEGVKDMAELKIPYMWSLDTGEPTKYKELTPEMFEKAKENIATIVMSMIETFMEVADKKLPKDDKIDKISASVDKIVQTIEKTLTSTADMLEKTSSLDKIFSTKPHIENDKFKLGFFADIYTIFDNINILLDNVNNMNGFKEDKTQIYANIETNLSKFTGTLDKVFEAANTIIKKYKNYDFASLSSSANSIISNIGQSLKDMNTIVEDGTSSQLDPFSQGINYFTNLAFDEDAINIPNGYDGIINQVETFKIIILKLNEIAENINNLQSFKVDNINMILTNISKIYKKEIATEEEQIGLYNSIYRFSKMTDYLGFTLLKVANINPFAVLSLNNIFDSITQLYEHKIERDSNGKTSLDYIVDDIDYFVSKAVNSFTSDVNEKSNNLVKSISGINNAMVSSQNVSRFKENVKQMQQYIKTINSINTTKLNPLTNLVLTLNQLSIKMGGLDKLAKVLSNELSNVLKELVIKLQESKDVINKTEEIQQKRHKLITDAISKISQIMDKPLEVKVSSDGSMGSSGVTTETSQIQSSPTGSASVETETATSKNDIKDVKQFEENILKNDAIPKKAKAMVFKADGKLTDEEWEFLKKNYFK